MKLSVNVVVNTLALVAQALAATQEVLPPRAKLGAVIALSAIQATTAVLAHYSEPPKRRKPEDDAVDLY